MNNQVNPVVSTQPAGQMPPPQPVQPGQSGRMLHINPRMNAGMMMQPQQPQITWMPRPGGPGGCPPGLEYLTQIDQILIKQQIDLFEMFTSWEVQNRYKVLNTMGQQVYFASEESDHCERQCCRNMRGFTLHLTDNLGAEVIRVIRDFHCCSMNCFACLDCCAQNATIEAPPGTVVGYIRQRTSVCSPNFVIMDADKNDVFYVTGPCYLGCVRGCPCDVTFQLLSAKDGETEVGTIQKQFSNLLQEVLTSADNFGVKFPMDLDVKLKAAVIGSTFLIDFMFFEIPQNRHRHHHY